MLTKYLTAITAAFSPFNAKSGKTARNFLALLPPNARSSMAIDVKMFGKHDVTKPAVLKIKFSRFNVWPSRCCVANELIEDGKEMDIDLDKMKIRDVQAEVDRHSRKLLRKEELAGDR